MHLGTCVTNPAVRDITVTASLFATLNLISGGRMELGIGRGDSSRRVLGKKPVTSAHLEESVRSFLPSYSLANDRIRRLYTALTTDDIESQPFWSDFKASAKRRNDAVHQGVRINLADAQLSCTLAEQLITHLDRVAAKIEPDRNVK